MRCLLVALFVGMGIDMDSVSGEKVDVDSAEGRVKRAVGRLRDWEDERKEE